MSYTTTKMDKFVANTIEEVLSNGVKSEGGRPVYKSDGAPAESYYITDVFVKFDLNKGELPISSLRPVYTGLSRQEMLWIYQDQTSDLKALRERGVIWWDDWALEDDTIGQRYGATVDRHIIIDRLLEGLDKNPFNRRNIINLWQYQDLDEYAKLPPCAFEVLFDVRKVNGEMYLDASLTQRSSDFLVAGMGINQIQYVSLQMMIAKRFGWKLGTFSWHVMNLHIYDRHIDNAKILLNRYNTSIFDNSPIEFYLDVPSGVGFYDIEAEDFKMEGYKAIGSQLEFDMAL